MSSSASTDQIAYARERDWERAWQPVMDAVGTDFGDGADRAGPDIVELGAIRRLAEPLEFGCPLHYDRPLATQLGYRDVAVPVSGILSFTIAPVWQPGAPAVFTDPARDAQPERSGTTPRFTGLEPPTTAYFAAEAAADYLTPVVVGDQLWRRGNRLVACAPKQTRVGRGAFTTWESEVRNQRDELVARLRNTAYLYVPHGEVAAPPAAALEPVVEEPIEQRPVDWGRQRWWDDLTVGEPLGAIRFPLSVYRLVMAAGSNRDFNSIHHNTEWARATGAEEMYANVVFLQGMWERCVREFIGVRGTIRQLSGFRMRSFNTVGDTVTVQGRVVRLWEESGIGYAELRVWSNNRHGVSVGPGSVVVTLPRRPSGAGTRAAPWRPTFSPT
ncbi:MaoC family dehydratase N-terminal domain-containing protein [Dactylosporangium sp. AC04546]|uniref:FAS1-like dehydratase domain-containing protein n=1 Tax=Dactylosporangium sp. AC04546 TaxID=2862460 RepID=UPI002E7BB7FA|nr:MaoC family dehydratase N-terminal domain-containing protein [Dactylosporangium sp. AC04546]WVK86907.1 MaoC family dehydratase N-terminal domain-containing protein [Dactylosporangium sp. AC04546]